jgi:hypothetical protein
LVPEKVDKAILKKQGTLNLDQDLKQENKEKIFKSKKN